MLGRCPALCVCNVVLGKVAGTTEEMTWVGPEEKIGEWPALLLTKASLA
jgi:hypothetical protein